MHHVRMICKRLCLFLRAEFDSYLIWEMRLKRRDTEKKIVIVISSRNWYSTLVVWWNTDYRWWALLGNCICTVYIPVEWCGGTQSIYLPAWNLGNLWCQNDSRFTHQVMRKHNMTDSESPNNLTFYNKSLCIYKQSPIKEISNVISEY